MKRKWISLIPAMALLVMLPHSCKQDAAVKAPYRALIVTGQNNHNCTSSTPILEVILESSGLFAVDIAKTAEPGGDMSTFKPQFSNYDVVVLDYTGDAWPEETNQAFVDYVSGGGGVVVYHAANNAFRDWKEYNRITGLGGWSGRDESDGPYVRWREGGEVYLDEPGIGGSHGPQHAFRVTVRDKEHPITRGLPAAWMHAEDELYQQLRGPAENLTVLATAFADTAKAGTGEHEPVLFTIRYGEGRVFHTTLGHNMGDGPYPAMECVGFIVTLQRGAEWAATGEVTQEVPEAFPAYSTLSRWPYYRQLNLTELMDDLRQYREGDSRLSAQDLSVMIKTAHGSGDFESTETALINFLRSKASADAKIVVIRELSLWGTERSLPALEKLMKEESTAEMARFAHERITGDFTN